MVERTCKIGMKNMVLPKDFNSVFEKWWLEKEAEEIREEKEHSEYIQNALHNVMEGFERKELPPERIALTEKFNNLRKEFGNRCEFCGYTSELEFAHILPTGLMGMGRGKKKRYYNIVNHKPDYLLLCKDCHRKFDKHPEKKLDFYLDPEHIIKRIIK